MTKRELANVLCVSVLDIRHVSNKGKKEITIPWYDWENQILSEYTARTKGKKPIPAMEWVIAASLNDCIIRHDEAGLIECLKNWFRCYKHLSFAEQELVVSAAFGALPYIQAKLAEETA